MENEKTDFLLPRMQAIGEGVIPANEFAEDGSLWIFLEEPDPNRWPPEMDHLKKYIEYERNMENGTF